MARNPLVRALAGLGGAIQRWASDAAPGNAPTGLALGMWGEWVHGSNAGQLVTDRTGQQHDVVQAVMERLAGAVAQLPLMVLERVGDREKRPAPDHPLYRLLHSAPCPGFTSVLFRDEQVRHAAWWRNAYTRILPDPETGYPIGQLEPIHPRRLRRVERMASGRVFYTFARPDNSGLTDTWSDEEIWHIKKAPLREDGLVGLPVWETSRETLGYALAIREFGALYFKNGGSGGVLEVPGQFADAEQRDLFLETWRAQSNGKNRHRDRVLTLGAKYTPVEVKNDEAQFVESKGASNVDVCRIWSMPPHMVGIMDKATFSNIEQQSLEFVIYTLGPWLAAIEQSASETLLIGADRDKYFVEFNVNGLLRGDFKSRYQGYAWGRQWGFLSANDVRRFENLPTIGPDGDRYLVPLNMSPTGSPQADGEATEPPSGDDATDGKPGGDPSDPQD